MANKKIDEIPAADPLDGSETLHLVQGANSRRATTAQIAGLGGGDAGLFADLGDRAVPGQVSRIQTSGRDAVGTGAAAYIADDLADAALLAAHPLAVAADSAGRHFRLLPDAAGLVSLAAMGCGGSETPDHSANHQPAIQAAIDYAAAIGAAGIRCEARHYSLWTPLRDLDAVDVNAATTTGIPILINRKTAIACHPQGTTLHRRKNDGSDPAVFAGTQVLNDGRHWRGGMILLNGLDAEPADYEDRPGLEIAGHLILNGGIPYSGNGGNQGGGTESGTYYFLNGSGDGWDLTDKAVWFRNNKYCGDLRFPDTLEITGFRGELQYSAGGFTQGSIVGGTYIASHTDANGFNPVVSDTGDSARPRVDVERMILHDCHQGLEGSAGVFGRIGSLEIFDCAAAGSLRAITYGSDPVTAAQSPAFTVGNLRVERSGEFIALAFSQFDKVLMIDTTLQIGGHNGLPACDIVVGDVVSIVDQVNVTRAIALWGSASGYNQNVQIASLHCQRTANARANNIKFTRAIERGYEIGDQVFVHRVTGEFSNLIATTSALTAYTPGIGDFEQIVTTPATVNLSANTTLTFDQGPLIRLNNTSGAAKTVTLPNGSANIPRGARLKLDRQSGSAPIYIATGSTYMNKRALLVGGNSLEFIWRGFQWELVRGERQELVGSAAIDVGAIPAGGTSAAQAISVPGADYNMAVKLVMHQSLLGNVSYDAVVSAPDTVSFVLHDLTGAGYDPASRTYYAVCELAY